MTDNGKPVVETTGRTVSDMSAEAEEQTPLETVMGDVQIQIKRIKSICDRVEAGELDVSHLTPLTLGREFHGNMLPLVYDTLKAVDRLEEFAEWASERIENLTGEADTASQLVPEDADRYASFLKLVASDAEARLAAHTDPKSDVAEQLTQLRSDALELLELTEDLRLEPPGADETSSPQATA